MSEQPFDIMISSTEYSQLKTHKKQHLELAEQTHQLALQLQQSQTHNTSLAHQLNQIRTQNSFLLQLIHNILGLESPEPSFPHEHAKSAAFEILGQSLFQPQKAQERQFNTQIAQYHQKYSSVIDKIIAFNSHHQSQNDLIARLQHTVDQNQLAITQLQTASTHTLDTKTKQIVELQKNQSDKKLALLHIQIDALKAQLKQKETEVVQRDAQIQQKEARLMQKEAQIKASKQECVDWEKQGKVNKTLAEKHKEENSKLSALLKDFSERTKQLQKQLQICKKKPESSPKVEAIVRIKALIDEHIRQVEKNLKAIEGLNQEQIKNLLKMEMKGLVDYVSKAIQNKH